MILETINFRASPDVRFESKSTRVFGSSTGAKTYYVSRPIWSLAIDERSARAATLTTR